MCVEFEQSGGSEAMEFSRWALPRQALEIPSLAVKNVRQDLRRAETVSIYLVLFRNAFSV